MITITGRVIPPGNKGNSYIEDVVSYAVVNHGYVSRRFIGSVRHFDLTFQFYSSIKCIIVLSIRSEMQSMNLDHGAGLQCNFSDWLETVILLK